MAQIPRNIMFTNRTGTTSQPDLLQQALQPVIDDEEQQNKYVITWVQTNENSTDDITQVIPAEMIFETNPAEQIIYEPCQNTDVVTNLQMNANITNYVQTPQQQNYQINFGSIGMQQDPATGSLAVQNDGQKWRAKETPRDTNLHKLVLNTFPVAVPVKQSDFLSKHSPPYQINNGTIEQMNQSNQEILIDAVRTSKLRKYKANEDDKKLSKYSYCVQKTFAQKNQADNTKVTEEQILQKLPKILPSTTQDIVRSTQTSILQTGTGANVQVLRDSKTVPTIISNQALNGANVFTYTRSMSNQAVLTPYIPAHNIIANTNIPTSFATKQISLPCMSNNDSVTLSSDLCKNIQVSPQFLNIPTGKNAVIVPEQSMVKTSLKAPTVKRLKTFTEVPYQTTTKADPRSLLKSAQLSLAHTSLLKPEVKMISKNANNQNSTIPQLCNSQNELNGITNASSNVKEPKPSSQNIIYLVQNGTNLTGVLSLSDTELKVRQILEQHKRNNIEQPGAETKNCIVLCRVISLEDVGIKNPANANTLSNVSINVSKPLSNKHNNSDIVTEKNRVVKRGRPKKSAIQSSALVSQSPVTTENEQKEVKDNLVKNIARTRSGRLSRPPKHMISDYKRLPFEKHLTCAQVDLDDSDGDYNRFTVRNDRSDDQQESTPLLDGLDVPKRNISDRFKCPTCYKYFGGRSRLLNHFEKLPDHGSCEQLSPIPEPVQDQNNIQDSLKRKGKKRGPWAYITPEDKSQRRMKKLEDALAICEPEEIVEACAKVLDIRNTYGLLMRKVDSNLKSSLDELKLLKDQIRKKVSIALTLVNVNEEKNEDMIDINNDWFSEYLGINPGVYKINNRPLDEKESSVLHTYDNVEGTAPKIRKLDDNESAKKKNEEQISSGGSETSELSVGELLNERNNSATNPTCPDVLSALTLIPKNTNSHPITNTERSVSSNTSNVLISSSEIQNQILDNPGFQKVNINTLVFEKPNSHNTFVDLNDSVEMSNNIEVFRDVGENYGQSTLDHIEQTFRRLEPDNQPFNNSVNTYQKEESPTNIDQMHIKLDNIETESRSFVKQFHNPSSMRTPGLNSIEIQTPSLHTEKMVSSKSFNKTLPSMPILDEPVTSNYENAFVGNENLYLFPSIVTGVNGEIDKNLSMESHSINVNSADVSNIDEIVKERLQNIVMPENVLETNLSYNANSYTDLNFEILTAVDFGSSINT